jgi:hypothetical protein
MTYRKTGIKDLWYGIIIAAYFGLLGGVAVSIVLAIGQWTVGLVCR